MRDRRSGRPGIIVAFVVVCVLAAIGAGLGGCTPPKPFDAVRSLFNGGRATPAGTAAAPATTPAPGTVAGTKLVATAPAGSAVGGNIADNALALMRGRGVEPYCLQLADPDDDGENEWIGLVAGQGRAGGVTGFVSKGDAVYPLGVMDATTAGDDLSAGIELSEAAACDIAVGDINGDGLREIVVSGRSSGPDGAPAQQVSVLAWDGSGAYRVLASYGGSVSAALVDDDGDGQRDIVVANLVAPGITLDEVSVWDGAAYVFAYSRYALAPGFGGPLPVDTAERALITYYVSLGRRDLAQAYERLSPTMRERLTEQALSLSMAAVSGIELGEVSRAEPAGDEVTVLRGELRLTRVENGAARRETYRGEWRMRRTDAGWQIDAVSLVAG